MRLDVFKLPTNKLKLIGLVLAVLVPVRKQSTHEWILCNIPSSGQLLVKVVSLLFSSLLCAALLWAPGWPLPRCSAGPAAQRPLPVRSEGQHGGHGGPHEHRRPVSILPSDTSHHSGAQLLAVRRQSTSVTAVTPDRRARQWSRWDVLPSQSPRSLCLARGVFITHAPSVKEDADVDLIRYIALQMQDTKSNSEWRETILPELYDDKYLIDKYSTLVVPELR